MRPVVITQAGAGTSAPVPLDRYIAPFSVALYTAAVGANYKVQYTYDDVFNVASGSITWFDDPSIPGGTTGNGEATYNNPISAVRLDVVSGTVVMTVNQAGIV